MSGAPKPKEESQSPVGKGSTEEPSRSTSLESTTEAPLASDLSLAAYSPNNLHTVAALDEVSSPPMSTPYFQVEYDLTFTGGDYDKVGNIAYIPEGLVTELGMEAAFEQITGHHPMHIIHYSEDERFTEGGDPFEE